MTGTFSQPIKLPQPDLDTVCRKTMAQTAETRPQNAASRSPFGGVIGAGVTASAVAVRGFDDGKVVGGDAPGGCSCECLRISFSLGFVRRLSQYSGSVLAACITVIDAAR